MSLVVVNQGKQIALESLLNINPPVDLLLKLFTNDITPSETDTEGDYTEVSGYGYSAYSINAGDWSITPGTTTQAELPEVTFTFTGGAGNIYGYYVTEDTSPERLLWAEQFSDGPYLITSNGDKINITLKIAMANLS